MITTKPRVEARSIAALWGFVMSGTTYRITTKPRVEARSIAALRGFVMSGTTYRITTKPRVEARSIAARFNSWFPTEIQVHKKRPLENIILRGLVCVLDFVVILISWKTAVHDVLPSIRTSFSPSYEDLL